MCQYFKEIIDSAVDLTISLIKNSSNICKFIPDLLFLFISEKIC